MTVLKTISTDGAPKAIGPYSQAITVDRFVFTAGQIPLDPQSGELVGDDIAVQTQRVFDSLAAVLVASGASPASVVKTTVYLADMNDFPRMNEVYGRFFGEHRPARSTVEVSRLPKDALVEIDAVAVID